MLRIYAPEDRVPVADIKKIVLRVREARRLTQGQLAKLLHISRKVIERIEQEAVQTVDGDLARRIQAMNPKTETA